MPLKEAEIVAEKGHDSTHAAKHSLASSVSESRLKACACHSFRLSLAVAAIFRSLALTSGAPNHEAPHSTPSRRANLPTAYVLGPLSVAMFKDENADVVLRFTWVRIFAEFK